MCEDIHVPGCVHACERGDGWLLPCLCLETVFACLGCSCKLLLQQDMGPVLFGTVASPRPFHLYPQGLPGSDPGQFPVRFSDVFVLDKKRPVLTDLMMVGSSQALSS